MQPLLHSPEVVRQDPEPSAPLVVRPLNTVTGQFLFAMTSQLAGMGSLSKW